MPYHAQIQKALNGSQRFLHGDIVDRDVTDIDFGIKH